MTEPHICFEEPVLNKCAICGRFRRWGDLISVWEPDTHFGPEKQWFECKTCRAKDETPEERKARYAFSNARAGLIRGILTLACLCGGAIVVKGFFGWWKVMGQ